MQETWVWSLGWEDPLEKEMAIHSRTIAWKIPWTKEPGRRKGAWGRKESDTTEWRDFTSLHFMKPNHATFCSHTHPLQCPHFVCGMCFSLNLNKSTSYLSLLCIVRTVRDFTLGAPKSLQMVTVATKLRHFLLGRKAMTNLESIFKSGDVTLSIKVHLAKALVFPAVMYRCESGL